jgi:hypothetical protein
MSLSLALGGFECGGGLVKAVFISAYLALNSGQGSSLFSVRMYALSVSL